MRAEKRRKNTKQKRYRRSTFGVVQALLHLTFYIYHLTLKIQCFVPGITHCVFCVSSAALAGTTFLREPNQ
ncbi:MAG TPA: hypothetical protein DDZ56_07710 [Cytophagales bacterium]|nr:hypothetical protein [Cytophagales bacterium]